jgi:hypothetical protein
MFGWVWGEKLDHDDSWEIKWIFFMNIFATSTHMLRASPRVFLNLALWIIIWRVICIKIAFTRFAWTYQPGLSIIRASPRDHLIYFVKLNMATIQQKTSPTDRLTCSLNLVTSHPGIFACDIWIARIARYRRFAVSSRARQLLPACGVLFPHAQICLF